MAKQNDLGESLVTEHVPAPATQPQRWIMPHELEVERVGGLSSGVTHMFPKVRGGVCEHCGVLDSEVPAEYQYKLCPHYRGKQLACSYCPPSKNVDDVIGHAILRIMQHPDNPKKLLIHCDSYDCKKRHEERWNIAATS